MHDIIMMGVAEFRIYSRIKFELSFYSHTDIAMISETYSIMIEDVGSQWSLSSHLDDI